MKNYAVPIAYRRISITVLFIVFLSLFLVSCEKEDVEIQTESYQMSVYDVLEQNSTKKADPAKKKAAPAPGEDAIATIAIEGGFNELVDALLYVDEELDAGLVNLFLTGTDQYTVFAPTDQAFEGLYTALGIDNIRDLPADLVLQVLLYHVTEGRRAANSVVPPKNYRTIETLLGESFKVNAQKEITAIGNTANIVAEDVSASNGIIHVIDGVILPLE
ncbi:fasciclin domain-containing protein [Salegentibacter sp. F14]